MRALWGGEVRMAGEERDLMTRPLLLPLPRLSRPAVPLQAWPSSSTAQLLCQLLARLLSMPVCMHHLCRAVSA